MMTSEGGKTLVKTMIEKHGSYEEYRRYMRTIASKGGQKTGPKGFAFNRDLAREAGRKGGHLSRRGPAKPKEHTLHSKEYYENMYGIRND